MSIIKIDNLSFRYESGTPLVIKSLSLEIEDGETVAIVGHNGSGKSTLAKLINGLLLPSKGDVTVNGLNTKDENNLFDIRKTVGVVFQNPDNQMIATIIEDDVAFGPENLGLAPEEIESRVEWALDSVGMLKERKGTPFKLSGGQKQRIAIAGVLALKPRVMILDESTAMLDPVGRRDVMNTIIELNREKGITVIMITHYMEEAALADRIIVLDDGNAILDGTPECVFAEEELLRSCGLNIPQCTELVHRLRERGIELDGNCATLEACAELILKSLCKTNA